MTLNAEARGITALHTLTARGALLSAAGDHPNFDDYPDMLSLPDVAQLLGVHLSTARRYAREGTIPCHRLPGGRRYYVLKDELIEFIRAQPPNPDAQDKPVEPNRRHDESE